DRTVTGVQTCALPIFLLQDGHPMLPSHWQSLESLVAAGFKVNPHRKRCSGLDELLGFISEWETKRATLPYETDGVVVKIDSVERSEERRVGKECRCGR